MAPLPPFHLALRCLLGGALLVTLGCPGGDVPLIDPLPVDDDDDSVDLGVSDPGAVVPFSAVIEVPDGETGTVILEFSPAWAGGEVRRIETEPGPVEVADLLAGRYGLRAWLDRDGDGAWDGIWEDGGEPSALLGVTLPRGLLRLPLRTGVPEPVLEDDPAGVELYEVAWELAADHVVAGTPQNGFADHYLDEAFSEQIFQWDTCFMTLFGRYGVDAYPSMPSLDNFYGTQFDDGYICRVVNESDGQAGGDASDPAEPMINPPLFAWVELEYARQTGDLSRLPRVLPVLEDYAAWIDTNVRTDIGLYYTSQLGSGMDNAPREEAYDAWVGISAQQALAHGAIADLAALLGDADREGFHRAEWDRICADVREFTWIESEGFFFDLDYEGDPLDAKTLAGVWPLLAGCATADQAAVVAGHLADPAAFWRVHVFPSLAADHWAYEPDGHYWLGGVWAPTTYSTVAALAHTGHHELARDAAANHIAALSRVHDHFVADPTMLSPEAIGDGSATLWEAYAPDAFAPATRWDDTYYGRQDFVGWTGVGPIALLLEQVVGLRADAPADTLTWRLTRTDQHGVRGYRFGDQLVDLTAADRAAATDPVQVTVDTSDAFVLEIVTGGAAQRFALPAGQTILTVSPPEGTLVVDPVPAGPIPGYAVVGNGRISAVVSDDDGSGDAPGIAHLYLGHFGRELLDAGRTRVVHDGDLIRPARVGLDPFFAAYTEAPLADGAAVAWRTFVGERDAVVVQGALVAGEADGAIRVVPHVQLRADPHIDGAVALADVRMDGDALVAEFSDGSAVALAAWPAPEAWQGGEVSEGDAVLGLSGQVALGHHLAAQLEVAAAAGEEAEFVWVLGAGESVDEAVDSATNSLGTNDLLAEAVEHWSDWAPAALCEVGPACRVAAANLYAARASSLGGMVPADLTGQFVTDDFPQLYPRDALMVARALEFAGHDDEAWEIVLDWLASGREGPSPGEWYARYDALGRAVDGGSGAAYDVPEWDCNGYLAALVERLGPDELTGAEQDVLLEALDFLVVHQDGDGLFTEGGIVEWEGRLPATAMTNWVGLDAGARLADRWGEPARAADYRAAAGRIRGGLMALFDFGRLILADERDGGLAYDTSMLFGPAWGYPANPVLDSSLAWFLDHATAHGGGVRYFEGMGYGQDLFYFTTSAATQYAAMTGQQDASDHLMEWMLAFTNRYGLAPERVYAGGSGGAEATPLSWCAAELAVAVLERQRVDHLADDPAIDGALDPAEYRRTGHCVVDGDGAPDEVGSPVVLCGTRDGDQLSVALRLAGPLDELPAGSWAAVFLADEEGSGAVTHSPGGQPLTFRGDPDQSTGAVARVLFDLDAGGCVAGPATGGADQTCALSAAGDLAVEARVDLATLGLAGPVQAIAVVSSGVDEELIPAHGALRTDGDDATVLVTLEVEAPGLALAPGEAVCLSGDRPELGAWVGHSIELFDDGTHGDVGAGDDVWTTVLLTGRGGSVAYKYMTGTPGDPTWDGVEYEGDDRILYVEDIDASGRVRVVNVFGDEGGELLDP